LNDAHLTAEAMGVANRANFINASIQDVKFEDETYDLITFIASMHHISGLESVLQKCYRALAPGGILWAAEYIGPDYFDFPAEHTRLAMRFWNGLDPKLTKSWEPALRFPTVEEVIAADPTESICSSRIISSMAATFSELQIVPTYGTFAFILSWGLNPDAIYENARGDDLVESVLEIDSALIDSNRLPHYFAYAIGRKLSQSASPSADSFLLARSLGTGISGVLFTETRPHRLATR
jgi:SAM-dependent methyltransferase